MTYGDIQKESTVTLLGNPTGASAAPSEITLGSGLAFSGTTLTATGSGGTVTSFSSGNLSPLFTTSVATPTSTPALSFTLSTVTAANQFFANTTGGSTPAFRSIAATDLPATITSNTSGNAATASALSPGATINGVTFTGAAPITVTAAMNTLTGTNYAAGNGSALTNLTAANISAGTAGISISGNAATVTTDANLTGPVTSVGNATSITANAVTYGDIQQESTVTLLGNPTGASAAPSEITLGSGLAFSGTTLTATGSGGTVTSFSSGNLSPLFTTSVATPTSTPALSFTLSTVASANQFFANTTAGSVPAFRSIAATDLPATITSNTSGNAATASALSPGATINGVTFTGAAPITVTAAMNTLTGTNYAAGNGSALTNLTAANISAGTAGISISGNAATVTTDANLTGPVTSVGNATSITANAVTYGDIQQESTVTLLGNPTGASAAPSEITLGSGLTFNGTVLNTVNTGTAVNYNVAPANAQITATTGDELFDVEYPSAGVASALGATIKSIATSGGTATGLNVSATGSTSTNTAIAATFTPGASSAGITVNGTTTATAGSFGLLVGTTHAPDIAAKLEGVSGDIFTAGGLSSTASTPTYSIKMAGSNSDNTNHSGAAIGITSANYPNGILAQGSISGIYGVTNATTSYSELNNDYNFGGSGFTGSFGVRGEAVGTAGNSSGRTVIGVWGLASGNSATNTESIGVLAQGGNGETGDGQTNVALDVENGELTMGMTSNPNGENGSGVTTVNNAVSGSEGPSGLVQLASGFASESGPYIQEADFQVGNEYCSSTSIIMATVQNDPDAGKSTYTVQATGQTSGHFTLVLTQNVLSGKTSTANKTVNVGYIIVNPSR